MSRERSAQVTRTDLAHILPSVFLLLLVGAGAAWAQEEQKEVAVEAEKGAASDAAVYGAEERVVETQEEKGGRLGYSFVGTRGYGGRALPYGFLHSSKSGGLFYRTLEKDGTFDLEGNFL